MARSRYQEERLHLLPLKSCGQVVPLQMPLPSKKLMPGQGSEWYFRNLSYLNGFWTLCAPQETFPLLKCVFFFSAGISHSSEVWRRTGGEAKAEGPNHILSLGELEQRRRPGI